MSNAAKKPPKAAATAFGLGFLTIGVGVLRSVEPTELAVRAMVVATVAYTATRLTMTAWQVIDQSSVE